MKEGGISLTEQFFFNKPTLHIFISYAKSQFRKTQISQNKEFFFLAKYETYFTLNSREVVFRPPKPRAARTQDSTD